MPSVSHLMQYSRRPDGSSDFVGGLPTHLPYVWPLCQICQIPMAFVGQLYASDALEITPHLALQFYVCDDCRKTPNAVSASGRVLKDRRLYVANTLHLEVLPPYAEKNVGSRGLRCKYQKKLYISYTPIEDSMDQWSFNRRQLAEEELADKHLREDKIGGLFPYAGYDGPKITKTNIMMAQFKWEGIGGTVYLYKSRKVGLYPYLYW